MCNKVPYKVDNKAFDVKLELISERRFEVSGDEVSENEVSEARGE